MTAEAPSTPSVLGDGAPASRRSTPLNVDAPAFNPQKRYDALCE